MTTATETSVKRLDADAPTNVEYCIPTWLRDEQIKRAIARPIKRIKEHHALRTDPIALVCYGPSLNDTWEEIKRFKYVMSCSGAHKFLIERGIVPTWHVEVDPRAHKVQLIGPPHPDVEYLIASTCHAAVFDHLKDYNVSLWHVFDATEDAQRMLPAGEWALTGGCSVGLRTMTIARFLGFTEQHIFGMDGCEGKSGKHAAAHPSQPKGYALVEYPKGSGVEWKTTSSMFEVARGTWHELDQMPDVKPTFYGEGLVQTMFKEYVPKPVEKKRAILGWAKPETISATYKDLNRQLHETNLAYGIGGQRHAELVMKIARNLGTTSILDYGCGKGYLAKHIPFPIWEYDPAIPGKDESPRPADLVVCTDVLEHIEPDHIIPVLADLQRVTKKVGYFTINTGPAGKFLADGRNAHLIQNDKQWWKNRLKVFFTVAQMLEKGPELHVIVAKK